MYNQPFFIPNYYQAMAAPSMMRGVGTLGRAMTGAGTLGRAMTGANAVANAGRSAGLFSRLGSSLSALRAINWGGLINNTSKTLGVINQAIPLVRQVGPMVNNMRSMLKVASIFKDETDKQPTTGQSNRQNNLNNNSNNSNTRNTTNQQTINYNRNNQKTTKEQPNTNIGNDSSPTFFIET